MQCVYDNAQLQYDTEHTSDNLPSCPPDKRQSSDVDNQSEGTSLTSKLFIQYIQYRAVNKERIINSGNFKQTSLNANTIHRTCTSLKSDDKLTTFVQTVNTLTTKTRISSTQNTNINQVQIQQVRNTY